MLILGIFIREVINIGTTQEFVMARINLGLSTSCQQTPHFRQEKPLDVFCV